jgi:hypothetical protein
LSIEASLGKKNPSSVEMHIFYIYFIILGRPRRRGEDNIKRDLPEVGGGGGDWMEQAQDRDRWWALVGMVMNFRVP